MTLLCAQLHTIFSWYCKAWQWANVCGDHHPLMMVCGLNASQTCHVKILCMHVWCSRIEKDDSPVIPYLYVFYNGTVYSDESIRVVSTCQMDVHKFPFDTQSCHITVGITMYYSKGKSVLGWQLFQMKSVFDWCALLLTFSPLISVSELRLLPFSNSSRATQFSRELMRTQGEWEFLQLSVTSGNVSFNTDHLWEQLTYTVRNTWTDTDKCQFKGTMTIQEWRNIMNAHSSYRASGILWLVWQIIALRRILKHCIKQTLSR